MADAAENGHVPSTSPAAISSGEKPAVLIIGGLGMVPGLSLPPHPPPRSLLVPPPFYLTETGLIENKSNRVTYSGYIGRFLALHIHRNNLASEVRLVDKVLPQLARLPPEFSEACSVDKFMQADASREREQCSARFAHVSPLSSPARTQGVRSIGLMHGQNPFPKSSPYPRAENSPTSSTAGAKPAIRRTNPFTRLAPSPSPSIWAVNALAGGSRP